MRKYSKFKFMLKKYLSTKILWEDEISMIPLLYNGVRFTIYRLIFNYITNDNLVNEYINTYGNIIFLRVY